MGTLQHIQHQIAAINDLIRINNDRVTGYHAAYEDITEPESQEMFQKHMDQSKQYAAQLIEQIHQLGGEPASGTTLSGKFYRTWMDLKAKVTGKDILSVLAACEYGEGVAEKAYREALDDKELIWQDKPVVTLLNRHLKGLITAHERIIELRLRNNKN